LATAFEVKVTRRGQTTIPKPLRKSCAIKEGDAVLCVDMGDHVAVLPVPKEPLMVLRGLRVEEKGSVFDIRRAALRTAQKLVEQKLQRA
jgi:AbrB family looped-hinge helix DNA binding protein